MNKIATSFGLMAALAAQAAANESTRVDPAQGHSYPTNVTPQHYRSRMVNGIVGLNASPLCQRDVRHGPT
jgi:Spy/CpxP family protein refolding chaperone